MNGLTIEQLARVLRRGPDDVQVLLEEERRRGHIERDGDVWRLAPAFEREMGAALRALDRRDET